MKTFWIILAIASGIGFFYLLAFALCRASGLASRAEEEMMRHRDYEE